MSETAKPMLYRNSGSTGWPHYYQNQDLYTFERHFIYEFAKTSLYEWQKQLGMLSPYAEVYYLPTEKFARRKNTNENETSTKGKDHEEKINTDTNKEEEIRENINFSTNTIPKPNEWKKVRVKKSKRADKTKIESPKEKNKLDEKQDMSNRFSIDQDNVHEEEIERCCEDKGNKTCKEVLENDDEEKQTYDIELMSIEEIKTYLLKDVEDNVHDYEKMKSYQNKVKKKMEEYQKELDDVDSVDSLTTEEFVDSEDESNGTVDSHRSTKSERDVVELISIDSDEEDTSDCTIDEVSTSDVKESAKSDNDNNMAKLNVDIESILYQNELLLVRLEQAELNEDALREENEKMQASVRNEERLRDENNKLLREKEEKELHNEQKINTLEKALKIKTELLIAALKEKGSNHNTRG